MNVLLEYYVLVGKLLYSAIHVMASISKAAQKSIINDIAMYVCICCYAYAKFHAFSKK